MARLLIQSAECGQRVLELKLGVNRLGRGPKNDFQLDHPTISTRHCEIELGDGELLVRDCGSTNGTFVAGQAVKEARVRAGQTFRLGEVALLVENTDVTVAIPKFDMAEERPQPPVVLVDGNMACPRHPGTPATLRCTHCGELVCVQCAHHLRRRGGRSHYLCPKCSHHCASLRPPEKKKKKSFLSFLRRTVKLPFLRGSKSVDTEVEGPS